MGRPLKDLTGIRFGLLTVVERHNSVGDGCPKWSCQCDCGSNVHIVAGGNLTSGGTISCGCNYNQKTTENNQFKHGLTRTKEYRSWINMKSRCYLTKDKSYLRYGGRGITVCAEWLNSFEQFFSDMGSCPDGMTLERIEVNGNYEKDNCKWATHEEQSNNKHNNVFLLHEGKRLTLSQWGRELNVGSGILGKWLKNNPQSNIQGFLNRVDRRYK